MTSNFYYQVGDFTTSLQWGPPSWIKIRRFLIELKKTELYKKYKIVLYGGCLYDIKNTNDLDIQLVAKDIRSYRDLENDFYKIYEMAINRHRLLVDVCFLHSDFDQSDVYGPNKYETHKSVEFIKINSIKKIVDSEITECIILRDEQNLDGSCFLTANLVKVFANFPSCLYRFIDRKTPEKIDKFFRNSKKFYTIDEFMNDTYVDFFNKTNK
jgi:hypothetical protein